MIAVESPHWLQPGEHMRHKEQSASSFRTYRGSSTSSLVPEPATPRRQRDKQVEDDDWGHFNESSEDEADSDCDVASSASQEKSRPTDNRFASSRFGACGGCSARSHKPLPVCGSACETRGLDTITSRKRLTLDDADPSSSSSSAFASNQDELLDDDAAATSAREESRSRRKSSLDDTHASSEQNTNPEVDDDLEAHHHQQQQQQAPPTPPSPLMPKTPPTTTRQRRRQRRRHGSEDNTSDVSDVHSLVETDLSDESDSSSDDEDYAQTTKTTDASSSDNESTTGKKHLSIEARVRKRRDDFCGDGRGKSTAWDVERWHVYAPNGLHPDRDDVVLTPAFASRVATRFFAPDATQESPEKRRRGLTISFAMGSIRVVSTAFDRYAQYELVVRVNGRPASSTWRRYSAFRAFVSSVAAESAPRRIVRTLSAWADAQDAKRIFRCTHPAYLIQRYYHFEHVLREALFELPSPELLVALFAPDDSDPSLPTVVESQPLSEQPPQVLVHPVSSSSKKTRSRQQTSKQRRRGKAPLASSKPIACAHNDDDDDDDAHDDDALSSDALSSDAGLSHETPYPSSPLLAAVLGVKDVSRRPN